MVRVRRKVDVTVASEVGVKPFEDRDGALRQGMQATSRNLKMEGNSFSSSDPRRNAAPLMPRFESPASRTVREYICVV